MLKRVALRSIFFYNACCIFVAFGYIGFGGLHSVHMLAFVFKQGYLDNDMQTHVFTALISFMHV